MVQGSPYRGSPDWDKTEAGRSSGQDRAEVRRGTVYGSRPPSGPRLERPQFDHPRFEQPPVGQPAVGRPAVGRLAGEPQNRRNVRVLTAVAVAVALVIGLISIGWAMLASDDEPSGLSAADSTTTPPSLTVTPTPTPTVTATPKPTTKAPTPTKTRPKPVVTTKPPPKELPPPPPPPKPDTTSCLTYLPGGNADKATVASVLTEAGSVDYWNGVAATPNPPPLPVSAQLMKAFAYVESSWRSTVIACDGGIGLMQVMPGTATWLNQRFDFSPAYDPKVMTGNAALGAALIQYNTFYFGSIYFGGEYDHDTVAPVGDNGASVRLGDVVIAAYNVGLASVENDNGTDDWADDTLSIPNQWYVDRVVNAMNTSPWTAMPQP